jgi:hypothetical protein
MKPRLILWSLVALDAGLAFWAFAAPGFWFRFFHGADRVDPQALLYRCGANWTAFLVLQLIAALRWRKERWWLFVVAGCRLGDCLTDITCLALAASTTIFAWIAFPVAGIGNLVGGVLLIRAGIAASAGKTSPS